MFKLCTMNQWNGTGSKELFYPTLLWVKLGNKSLHETRKKNLFFFHQSLWKEGFEVHSIPVQPGVTVENRKPSQRRLNGTLTCGMGIENSGVYSSSAAVRTATRIGRRRSTTAWAAWFRWSWASAACLPSTDCPTRAASSPARSSARPISVSTTTTLKIRKSLKTTSTSR